MLGLIKKGESVIGMRAVKAKDWTFSKGLLLSEVVMRGKWGIGI